MGQLQIDIRGLDTQFAEISQQRPHRPSGAVPKLRRLRQLRRVAPIEVSSGRYITHRLSRSGDRQLHSALHFVAVTQVRMRFSSGRRFFDRKITEGKTRNEAVGCLTRRIASHV